jgi:phosphoglycerate dehydrogenase-like enzyme
MKSLNVLVVHYSFDRSVPHPDEAVVKKIASVNPCINVKEMAFVPGEPAREIPFSGEPVDDMLARADVIFGFLPPRDILTRAPNLKWLQTMSAGIDRLVDTEIWHSPVKITGVSGIHAVPISEYVLGIMLMFAKKSVQFLQMQQRHEWNRYPPSGLRGKTVGIVGLGSIGREVARLCRAFGMRVIATRRSIKRAGKAGYVDLLLPADELKRLLAESDYVVIAAPLTHETEGLIGEEELEAMKSTAYIINIARGGIIDENAIVRALKEKHIAGAGLDVTSPEPLPPESPLWDMENVILTPHISGAMEDYIGAATDLFCDNIRRYLAGKRLRNVIDKKKGY